MKPNFIIIIYLIFHNTYSQNTIGILRNDPDSFNGYTLLSPLTNTGTYLINNCGEVVHEWNSSSYSPAASVYLLENGNLLRTAKINNTDITFGGVGGKIELFDWDGNLLWEYLYSSNLVAQHHDIYPLPNGNILMLAVSTMTEAEAQQAGRDPSQIDEGKIYNEQILELEPVGANQANIVWEWNIKDHLIQDFDNTKDNFGIVEDNEQLLDFNYLNATEGNANWLHFNSIQYNETLDQIIISSRILSEIYIIDHSTTSVESAAHSGGDYGKGGDFLYRWGNPESYRHGTNTDRTLYGQHYPHWIAENLTDEGKIMLYNNGSERSYSSIDIIAPVTSTPGVYLYNSTNGYEPISSEWSYTDAEDPVNFFSAILSSGQRLPNGNTLICDGDSGYFFEIDSNKNIVWEYINPVSSNGPLTQGDIPVLNLTFRAHKFPENYPAFEGKDLTPTNPIELDYNIDFCEILSISENHISNKISLFPNPTEGTITINSPQPINKIEIYDIFGKLIKIQNNTKITTIESLASGIYIAKIYSENQIVTKKILKI